MDVVFDPAKDAGNCAKHGVSLALATAIEWDSAVIWPDLRHDYGEPRQCALGYIGLRLYFVDRGGTRRIISLRKANRNEVTRYAQT